MRISIVSKMYAAVGVVLCGLIAIGVWWQRRQFPVILDLLDDDTRSFLTTTLFRIGGQPVRVLFLIKAFLFLIFLNILARLARGSLGLMVGGSARIDKHRQYLLSKAVTLSIYTIGLLIGIQIEGINFTTLAIIGGTLGVGVGFGLQNLVSNFVAGLILLIEQPVRLGDRIEFGGKTGEVIRVGSRSSSIRTYDNAVLIIPNSDFVTKEVLNWTVSDPKIRITIAVPVAYGTSPEDVVANLLKLAGNHPDVMKDPAPDVLLSDLGASAITFSLRVWTISRADSFAKLRSDLYVLILRCFREQKIEMPLPQLDLHVRTIESPVLISNPEQDIGRE
ncbi:MAG TPA: mechanosensitive ion channel domain-containing protein [Candidatus Acidoferrum sp.]